MHRLMHIGVCMCLWRCLHVGMYVWAGESVWSGACTWACEHACLCVCQERVPVHRCLLMGVCV